MKVNIDARTENMIYHTINHKVTNNDSQEDQIQTVEKKEILLIFPYLGTLGTSESFEKRLKSIVSSAYQQVSAVSSRLISTGQDALFDDVKILANF